MASLLTTPIPHEDGAALIEGKLPMTRAHFDRLLPELRGRAFMVTGVECTNVLQRVRDLTAELPLGGDFDDLKGKILDELSPWLITATDPEERAKQLGDARRRAELLLRMHGWQAYAQTQYEELEEQKDVFPFRQYLSSDDNRVRHTHAALNEKIFPSDDPFWLNHTPPWEFGCRCDVVGIMADEADEIRDAEQAKPEEQKKLIEGAQLEELKQGRLRAPDGGTVDIRTPKEKNGKGYEYRPGDQALDLDQVLDRYDAGPRAEFEKWAKSTEAADGRTVWESLGGDSAEAPPTPSPAPAAPTPKPAAPARKSPVSAALTVPPRIKLKAKLERVLKQIDAVHDDGKLPPIPVASSRGRHLGVYQYKKVSRAAVRIGIKPGGSHPQLTLAHEVGHFLDHHGLGTPGVFDSETPGTALYSITESLRATPTFARLLVEAGGNRAYYAGRDELWARAYAQYIAEESGDLELMADLNGILTGFADWRQWPAAEFAPIREQIRAAFAAAGWNPYTPSEP